ncbi:MAG: hypothetical protein GY854_18630 [Deltaproteobacteria bacterium]|nr:hypothetical protein [Deltaproteobacteria bacterium]
MDPVTETRFQCPVCGYPELVEPPWQGGAPSDEICPSCGIHFGFDDVAGGDPAVRLEVYKALRAKWEAGGCRWFSSARSRPEGWDPIDQLRPVRD